MKSTQTNPEILQSSSDQISNQSKSQTKETFNPSHILDSINPQLLKIVEENPELKQIFISMSQTTLVPKKPTMDPKEVELFISLGIRIYEDQAEFFKDDLSHKRNIESQITQNETTLVNAYAKTQNTESKAEDSRQKRLNFGQYAIFSLTLSLMIIGVLIILITEDLKWFGALLTAADFIVILKLIYSSGNNTDKNHSTPPAKAKSLGNPGQNAHFTGE